jgi:hypothetical protein
MKLQLQDRSTQATFEFEVTEPLEFDGVGKVEIKSGGYVHLGVSIDPPMKKQGITRISDAFGVEMVKDPKSGALVRCLKVSSNKGRGYLALADRPMLDILVANRDAIKAEIDAVQSARSAVKRQAEREQDDALRAVMRAEAESIAARIPTGHIRVVATKVGDADGDPIMEYSAEGTKVRWDQVTTHGTASAIRPGAWGAFDSVTVASISEEKLAEIRAAMAAKSAAVLTERATAESARAAAFAEARTTGQPVHLETHMQECDGSVEECSTDAVSTYAMPDGSITTRRTHTF